MTTSTDAQIRSVSDRWHEMAYSRNLEGLMDLYTEDAVLESAAILVIEKDPSGILRGKEKLRPHFAAFFAMMEKELADKEPAQWLRQGTPHTDGATLSWEYPAKGEKGEQLDVVESVDLVNGKIAYQRVYWGYVGFRLLTEYAKQNP